MVKKLLKLAKSDSKFRKKLIANFEDFFEDDLVTITTSAGLFLVRNVGGNSVKVSAVDDPENKLITISKDKCKRIRHDNPSDFRMALSLLIMYEENAETIIYNVGTAKQSLHSKG